MYLSVFHFSVFSTLINDHNYHCIIICFGITHFIMTIFRGEGVELLHSLNFVSSCLPSSNFSKSQGQNGFPHFDMFHVVSESSHPQFCNLQYASLPRFPPPKLNCVAILYSELSLFFLKFSASQCFYELDVRAFSITV